MQIRHLLMLFGLLTPLSSMANDVIQQAINNPDRPAEDKLRDSQRQPDKVLAFFEFKPEQQVLDVFSGSGYYTELVARIVGPKGHVDAHNNAPYIKFIGEDKITARYADKRLPNVTQLMQDANSLELPTNHYDRILFILSFHDLYHVDEQNGWDKIDDQVFMTKLLDALTDDGILGLVDHIAPAGSGTQAGESLHRIDPAIIRQKMAEWGFKLIAEETFLHNSDDPLDIPMWDKNIRGKTSRVVMKFTPM
ncbi:class I SAM-dependent methyltransferase [Neptunicella sp. SCSIO 80796]|uniref:class I SAM-dependent methyltransferase n=1 Tax=Neptunicella plasticusilytica TaxID=3117012 RepID=UPI003A4D7645